MSIFGNERRLFLEGEAETVKLGSELARLAQASEQGLTVFLDGDLGMGKTTLSRGVIRALGHEGAVKSPTYTLVEPYDYFASRSFRLIEWPERGEGILPDPDIEIHLEREGEGRSVVLRARSELGARLLNEIELIGPES